MYIKYTHVYVFGQPVQWGFIGGSVYTVLAPLVKPKDHATLSSKLGGRWW